MHQLLRACGHPLAWLMIMRRMRALTKKKWLMTWLGRFQARERIILEVGITIEPSAKALPTLKILCTTKTIEGRVPKQGSFLKLTILKGINYGSEDLGLHNNTYEVIFYNHHYKKIYVVVLRSTQSR